MNWTYEEKLPDGHRLFSTTTSDGIDIVYAIADDSGTTPNDTDDGVQWLDVAELLIVDMDESFDPPRQWIAIPLVDNKGNRSRTPSDVSTLLHLANKLKWQIEDRHVKAIYEVN